MSQELIEMLRIAPDSQMDPVLREDIASWGDTPAALDVLRALDHTVYYGLASGLVVTVLETILKDAMTRENVSMKELCNRAMWRDDLN